MRMLNKFWIVTFFCVAAVFLHGCGDSRSVSELLQAGTQSMALRQWDVAAEILTALTEKAPDDYRVRMLKAFWSEMHDVDDTSLEQAVQYARSAADMAPFDFEAQHLAGRLLVKRGKDTAAQIKYLEAAIKIKSDDPATLALLGRVYRSVGLPESYEKSYLAYSKLAMLDGFQRLPELQNELGTLSLLLNNQIRAIRHFQLARRYGAPPVVLLNIARTYDYYLNDPVNAKKYYSEFLVHARNQTELVHEVTKARSRAEVLQRAQPRQPTNTRSSSRRHR